MPVKIRLQRQGKKHSAFYHIVVADSRAPRDGKFIEKLGTYNPNVNPASVVLNKDKAVEWLFNGAQPTDTTRTLLSHQGVLYKKHLQVGVNKGSITQEQADAKFAAWETAKIEKVETASSKLAKSKTELAAVRFSEEAKIKDARAKVVAEKKSALAASLAAAAAPVAVIVAPVAEAEAPAEEIETPVEEAAKEESSDNAPEASAEETPAAE